MENQNTQIKIIKKYKNRRLYDLDRSQYVTVEDLQVYVLNNTNFKVLDAATNKDLTNATLLQIFVELESNSTQLLSTNVLRQLIKLAKHPMVEHYKLMFEDIVTKIEDHLNPFMDGVQSTTELWLKQSERAMKSWHDWLKNRGE